MISYVQEIMNVRVEIVTRQKHQMCVNHFLNAEIVSWKQEKDVMIEIQTIMMDVIVTVW